MFTFMVQLLKFIDLFDSYNVFMYMFINQDIKAVRKQ